MSVRRDCPKLLCNQINEDFQKLLRPLNLIQTIYFYPKYKIRDNFITPNGRVTQMLSFCVTVAYLILSCYHTIICNIGNNALAGIKNIPTTDYISFANSSIGFIINFINCLLCSDDNVRFVLKLQEVYKVLRSNETQLKTMTVINWIFVSVILITDIMISISFLYNLKDITIFRVLSYLIYMSFDFNMVYATCMIHLLRKIVVLWNFRVRDEDEFCWKGMFNVYIKILEAYVLYQKVFQTHILYHLLETFVLSLVFFQMWLDICKLQVEIGQYHNILLTIFILVVIWLIKTMSLHITLNTELEKFYIAINEAQSYSIRLSKLNNLSATERQARKNIQRVNRVAFSKMRVYCLFTIDATLPLRMTYTIATYMIVQLQIALQLNENDLKDRLHNNPV